MLDERCITSFLANLRVALAQGVKSFLFFGLHDQCVDVYWPTALSARFILIQTITVLLSAGIQRHHGESTIDQNICIFDLLTLFRGLCDLHRDLQAASTCGICDPTRELKVTDFVQRVENGNSVAGGGDCSHIFTSVLVPDTILDIVQIRQLQWLTQ